MRSYGWGLNPIGLMALKEEEEKDFSLSLPEEVVWAQMRWWPHTSQEKRAQKEASPAGSLILDFEPPELWEVHFCCSNHSVFGVLLWQLWLYYIGIKCFIIVLAEGCLWGVIVSRPSVHTSEWPGRLCKTQIAGAYSKNFKFSRSGLAWEVTCLTSSPWCRC